MRCPSINRTFQLSRKPFFSFPSSTVVLAIEVWYTQRAIQFGPQSLFFLFRRGQRRGIAFGEVIENSPPLQLMFIRQRTVGVAGKKVSFPPNICTLVS
jgi:hypothetical protein